MAPGQIPLPTGRVRALACVYDRRGQADQPNEPADQKWQFWELSREERLLWVTFIGGVASFIVGAIIIGLALAVARIFTDRFVLALVTAGTTAMIVAAVSEARRRVIRLSLWFIPILVAAAGLCLLGWVGIAAGIK